MKENSQQAIRKVCLKSYITEAEHARVVSLAEQCGLSASELVRRVVLGQTVNSKVDRQSFLDLLQINADLGRLGGLLKFGLSDESPKVVTPAELRRVLHEVEDCQEEMRQLIRVTEKLVLNRAS